MMYLFAFITFMFVTNNVLGDAGNRVDVTIYYESLCPLSRQVYTRNLLVVARNLSDYITLKTNPYGFAKTYTDEDGKITFKCQHGPDECYGNKIQSCALKYLTNWTLAVEFNGCMMEMDSITTSVNECASRIGIDADPVTTCANSDEGNILLRDNGAEIEQLNLPYLPSVLINGNVSNDDPYGRHLYDTICKAFTVKPAACQ